MSSLSLSHPFLHLPSIVSALYATPATLDLGSLRLSHPLVHLPSIVSALYSTLATLDLASYALPRRLFHYHLTFSSRTRRTAGVDGCNVADGEFGRVLAVVLLHE